jgi:hypothetical protein
MLVYLGMTERNEISGQEVAFYRAALAATDWSTAKTLADVAGIAHRSGRAYALKFVKLGLLDLAEVWPAHRYRWSKLAAKRNRAYVQRLEQAAEVFP